MLALLLLSYANKRNVYNRFDEDESFEESNEEFSENEGLVPPVVTNGIPATHSLMLKLVNQERSKKKLNSLSYSQKLSTIVKSHNDGMISGKVKFGHDGFNSRYKKSGMSYAGENVAYCYANDGTSAVKQLHKMWMNSSGHKANILGNFVYFGFALGHKGQQYYGTQFFGRK